MANWFLTWAEINTIVLVLTTLMFIGKFFCVGFCVSIYDSTEKRTWGDDGRGFMWAFYWISIPFVVSSWIFYFYEIPPGFVISTGGSSVCLFISTVIILCYWLARKVGPGLHRFHRELKNKKGLD